MKPEFAARLLSWIMIAVGGMAALALVPMVMPTEWMVIANDRLGLGPYPRSPLTEYLTRSASALYAMTGAMTLYLGLRVRQYLPLISFIGWLTAAFGVALTVIDFWVGMPASWSWGEGPPTVAVGFAFVWLSRRAQCGPSTPEAGR